MTIPLQPEPPYSIAIDARMYHHSGIGRYIENLLNQYKDHSAKDFNFNIYGNLEWLNTYREKTNFSIHSYTIPIYSIKEQLFFPKNEFGNSSLLHVPHYNIPILYSGKLIITVYDLIHLLFPQSISSYLGRSYSKFLMKKAVNHATKIITISNATKNDLIKHLNVPEEKIEVIYCGSPTNFSTPPDSATTQSILDKYSIHKPYLLHVGIDKPHKNMNRLIEAFGLFLQKSKSQHTLVIVGPRKFIHSGLKEKLQKQGLENKIILTKYIPDSELNVLYHNTDLFVFPSLYEGFGLPTLEAMSAGVPVITSNTSSLPETVGDAALLFDPYKIESISDAIYRVLTNPQLRAELIGKGKKRVGQFSWEKNALQTLEVYRKVLHG